MSKRWIVEPGNECNPTETNPMAMQNVVLTFVIIGMAFVVSLIILIIELLVSCCTSRYLTIHITIYMFIVRLDAIVRFITIITIFISSQKDKLADFKKEQRKLDSRIINDHRLVSSVFQAEYPYYSRYISRRGLIDPYGQSYGRPRPYPSARAFEEAFKEAF